MSVWGHVLRNERQIEALQGSDRSVVSSVTDELEMLKDDLMVLEAQTATALNRINSLEQVGTGVWQITYPKNVYLLVLH